MIAGPFEGDELQPVRLAKPIEHMPGILGVIVHIRFMVAFCVHVLAEIALQLALK